MATELQKAYKAKLDEIDALKKDNGGDLSKFTEVALKTYTEALDAADALFQKVELEDKEAKLREAAGKSAGSYVAASFLGDVPPGSGELPGITADPQSGELFAMDGPFKSLGEKQLAYFKSGAYKDAFVSYIRARGDRSTMKAEAFKILAESPDTSGGFWVPPDFRPELIKKMAVMATVRPNAKVYTSGSDHITFPQVNYNNAANASGDDANANLFTSGVRFTWRSSTGAAADFAEATNPIAGQINIPIQLATAAIVLTREQVEDNSFDLLGYINELGAEAFTLGEESAFTNGTGAGQPQGFMQHPANIATTGNVIQYSTYATRQGTTYWGNIVLTGSTTSPVWGTGTTGIIGMEANLPPQYEANAKWYAAKSTYAAIRAINAGTATLPQWALGDAYPNYANGMQANLLGYPIVKNQFIDSVVTTGHAPLVLGDMMGYFIADRVGLSVEVFREVYGLRDQVVVYMRKRTGGQLVHYWKMRVLTCT